MGSRVIFRVAAALLAAILTCLAFYAGLFVALGITVSAQAPDPFVSTGDPCCGHPDDWVEVVMGMAGGIVMAAIVGGLLALAVALLFWSVRRRPPRWRRLALVPLGVACVALVCGAVLLVPEVDEARAGPDCDDFRVRSAHFRSTNDDLAKRTAHGIIDCRSLSGRTTDEVLALLGPPALKGTPSRGRFYWSYDYVDLDFEQGKVTDASFPN